ncbi:MAG: N-acetylmuramoyl-L-alanine amidase [Nitratireductor sp.]|nr:N-acetylmuramoyl-L-alanine amidase [Nitratireductor sp.]MCB1459469.1 N-acetylmuramoyl-L-alanine amidase [Nitratireductor sp.]
MASSLRNYSHSAAGCAAVRMLIAICCLFWLSAATRVSFAQEPAPVPADQSSASAGEEKASAPVLVFDGSIKGDAKTTRFTMDFDHPTEFDSFFMDSPLRLVIDGPSMLFRFADANSLEPKGLVTFLRYGAIARERSRVVISLSHPARMVSRTVETVAEGSHYRLSVELEPVSQAEFTKMIAEQQRLVGTSGEVATIGDRVRPAPKQKGRITIVIDPGHGGIDGGAKGVHGTQEKDLTLEIARRLGAEIGGRGPFDIRLTRSQDVFLSLRERVAFSQRNQADLVISIHADSLRQNWVRGATVYTLSRKASDNLAHEIAESENASDLLAGLDDAAGDEAVPDILADLTLRETTRFSRFFSSILVEKLDNEINLIKNPERSAAFAVLKAPEIPSVLIELGYLSNPDDEKLMTDEKWQKAATARIADAVLKFFEPRLR